MTNSNNAQARSTSADIAAILKKRHDNGADFWATADGRWGKGSPFSSFDCVLILIALGVEPDHEALQGAAQCLWDSWREDGRFRPAPKATMHPCHTANAARALCRLNLVHDERLQRTLDYLLNNQHPNGGWRCNTVKQGKAPETDAPNPGVTLAALDAFRFDPAAHSDDRLHGAIEHLLGHWEFRKPLGPCAFGIGSRFMETEFPFFRYNLFFYVYVLSFYQAAQSDPRFAQALDALNQFVTDGQLVVSSPNRRLAKFSFCKKGEASEAATRHYREVLDNLS